MKSFIFYIEYVGLKILLNGLSLLPESILVKVGEEVGKILTKLMPNRYKRSIKDVQKAFPEKTEKECKEIAFKSWENIGRISAEFAKAIKMKPEEVVKKIKFKNTEVFFERNKQGQGGILHLGHFANWEVLGLATAVKSTKMAFVARPQNNPYVDKYANELRGSFGSKMISAYTPFFACFRALKRGTLIAILGDQSVPASKMYMNFLGRPAEVGPMSAVLSLKTNLPIYCIRTYREGKQIVAECTDVIYPPKVEYSTQAVYDLTKILKEKLETYIKQDPASWLWAHNRWKREEVCRREMLKENIHGH